jgi:hypothetical protein
VRVKVDDRVQRAILEDGVREAGIVLGSFMDLFDPPREEMLEQANTAVRMAFRDVFRRYDLRVSWSGDNLDPGSWERFIGAEWNEDEDGCGWVPSLVLRGLNFKGMTCEMPEERMAAEMMR